AASPGKTLLLRPRPACGERAARCLNDKDRVRGTLKGRALSRVVGWAKRSVPTKRSMPVAMPWWARREDAPLPTLQISGLFIRAGFIVLASHKISELCHFSLTKEGAERRSALDACAS